MTRRPSGRNCLSESWQPLGIPPHLGGLTCERAPCKQRRKRHLVELIPLGVRIQIGVERTNGPGPSTLAS